MQQSLLLAGLEAATLCVLGGRDNHYTTETTSGKQLHVTKHVVQ